MTTELSAYFMTVGKLRAEMDGLPDDLLVVLSRDPEGNGFGPLSEVSQQRYRVADRELADDEEADEDEGDGPGDDPDDAVPCLAFWPC